MREKERRVFAEGGGRGVTAPIYNIHHIPRPALLSDPAAGAVAANPHENRRFTSCGYHIVPTPMYVRLFTATPDSTMQVRQTGKLITCSN